MTHRSRTDASGSVSSCDKQRTSIDPLTVYMHMKFYTYTPFQHQGSQAPHVFKAALQLSFQRNALSYDINVDFKNMINHLHVRS